METKRETVARNLQFDLGPKSKSTTRTRSTRSQKTVVYEDSRQLDIRETMLKVNKEIEEDKKVIFEKLGCLSPKKSTKKRSTRAAKTSQLEEKMQEPTIFKTPTKQSPAKTKEMSYDEIKNKVTTSSRLAELRAKIAKFKNCEDKLEKLNKMQQEKKEERKKNEEKLKIKEFERIELEIPMSPSKSLLSPNKFMSPTKTIQLSPKASPARRLLFEPKEVPASPVKCSPTKAPAYQRYQSLVEADVKTLPLPYKYRFLAEVFRSIDTVSAMLYNRREIITFNKLKPAVQELLRRNFTLDHLAQVRAYYIFVKNSLKLVEQQFICILLNFQIKTLYPDAFSFRQEKMRSFGSTDFEKYELVITPVIETDSGKNGRNTPDAENVLKSALQTNMGPSVLLDRRRKFYNELLEVVKDEHEKFLLSLEPPMRILKEKITRWHPEFEIEKCREIEKAELPEPPMQEKMSTAKDVLQRANKLFNDNSRMKKAIELLADHQTKVDGTTSK